MLTYYGNLLDAEILGKGTMRQDINDVNRFFNSGDQSLTGPDTTEMGYLLQMFSEDLSRIKKERKMKDYDLFKAYDQDKNQRVSLAEFKTVSEKLKAMTLPADLDKIFAYLDKNGSGSIDLAELFKVLSFDINEYYKEQSMNKSQSDPNSIENWKSERIILEFMKLVEDYMRRTGSSIYQIYAQMDKKPDSQVDRREITVFIREKMAIKSFPDGHLNVVLNTIDKDVDKKITMREFVEFLKLRDVYRMVNSEKEREEMRELKVLRVLYDLMYVTDKTPIDLIHEIDSDNSGTIDPVELAFYVKDLKGDIATHDIDKFMHYVDKNVSNSLEMKEVENALQAYILLMDQERDVPNEQIEALLAKLIPIIDNNKSKLKEMMVILSDKHNSELIREENMRKILEGSRLFSEVEIDMIINPICSPFTTFRRIRYNNFFDLKKQYARHLKMKESGLGIRRGKVLVDQLFKVLKKVGKKHHLNEYELFQCFDTDDSGSVTLTEMK